jgi:branched-subunit amino acid transport protein
VNLVVVLALAALTYGSRAAAVLFLPPPPTGLQRVLERIPAPVFAGLATLSLIDPNGSLVGTPILAAALGGLITSPFRSLPICLAGGLIGYGIATLVIA